MKKTNTKKPPEGQQRRRRPKRTDSRTKRNASANGHIDPKDVTIEVAPCQGRGSSRLVILQHGEQSHRDKINTDKAGDRAKMIKDFATKVGADAKSLAPLGDKIVSQADEADETASAAEKNSSEASPDSGAVPRDDSEALLAATPDDVRKAAQEFLHDPNLFDKLDRDFTALGIAGEPNLARTIYLLGTSRKLQQPLAACIKAPTASRKSFVANTVVSLFPDEDLLEATDITAAALYYMPAGALKHKLVFVAERKHVDAKNSADAANAGLALREMISSGKLSKLVPIRGEENGFVTQRIEQEGPIAYVETTTTEVFEEDANRMLALATNESRSQTQRIMEMQAAHTSGTAGYSAEDQEWIRQVHHAAQRMLKRLKVRVPYASRLIINSRRVIARRAFPQLLGVIRAVALLRQFQKEQVEEGLIDADVQDYEVAYRLMLPILRRTFAPLAQRASDLLRKIREHAMPPRRFNRRDCQEWTGLGDTEIRNRLHQLVDAGCVEIVQGVQGKRYEYQLLDTQDDEPQTLTGLISPGRLRELLDAEPSSMPPQSAD